MAVKTIAICDTCGKESECRDAPLPASNVGPEAFFVPRLPSGWQYVYTVAGVKLTCNLRCAVAFEDRMRETAS